MQTTFRTATTESEHLKSDFFDSNSSAINTSAAGLLLMKRDHTKENTWRDWEVFQHVLWRYDITHLLAVVFVGISGELGFDHEARHGVNHFLALRDAILILQLRNVRLLFLQNSAKTRQQLYTSYSSSGRA